MLNPGDPAPDFDLMTQDPSRRVRLSDLRGRKVVLLFYPMDFSPVCTDEHCAFGPDLGRLAVDADTVVLGVSCDSPFAHAAFKTQYGIPYDLLSDVGRKAVKDYGFFMGEEPFNCGGRGTVVVDRAGRVAFWEKAEIGVGRRVDDLAAAVARA